MEHTYYRALWLTLQIWICTFIFCYWQTNSSISTRTYIRSCPLADIANFCG